MKKYKLIDHTADFGIEVTGSNQKELFVNAALAMFDWIVDTASLIGQNTYELQIRGTDICDLLIDWLKELLYLYNGKQMLIKTIDISSISERKLSAKATYDSFDPDIHEIKNEIKAVTYHQAKVKKSLNGWIATIIFDV